MFEMFLMLAVIIMLANLLVRFVPFLSVPVVQVLLGAVAMLWQPQFQLNWEPHLFMLIFIGPLLFNDGMHANKRHLWHKRKAILLMALVLVVFTVVAVGYLIHFLVPDISLPMAFALAAALSPTDYVAVSALSKKVDLPDSISPIIEGEGLMNDATGLVSFKFALAAALSGTFSLWEAGLDFLVVALGGAVLGGITQVLILKLEDFIAGLGMEDMAVEVILHLLTPFIVYFVAEEMFGVSGVLAVVAAGMLYTSLRNHRFAANEKLSEMKDNIWSVLVVVLNGLVFTMVGFHLPAIIQEYLLFDRPLGVDILYILLISLALYGVRFFGVLYIHNGHLKKFGKLQGKEAMLTALTGVRGAVTLATILSVPIALTSTTYFPVRELLLFYGVGVIVVTMLVATLLLPLLAKKDTASIASFNDKLKKAQAAVWRAAIWELEKGECDNFYVQMLLSEYRNRILNLESQNSERVFAFLTKESQQLKLELLNLEQEHVEALVATGEISGALGRDYLQMLERKIALLSHFGRYKGYLKRILYRGGVRPHRMEELQGLHYRNGVYIIDYLKANLTPENEDLYQTYIQFYSMTRLQPRLPIRDFSNEEMKKYKVKSLQLERNTIQHFYEEGKITWHMASALRKTLNYAEAEILRDI